MSTHLCQSAIVRFLVFTAYVLAIVAWDPRRENDVSAVKRDTTLENVKAMYNRFVSPSMGKAKYVKRGKNACSLLDPPPSIPKSPGMLHVAASKDDFQSSLGCGVCLTIKGSGIPAAADLAGAPPVKGTLNAIVVDQDDTLSQGDLAVLPPQSGSGLWLITFKAVDCPTGQGPTEFIQFRFTGSNDMYFKLQASNAKVPVAGIEAYERVKGRWICLTKTPDNFFSSEGVGAVSFPLKVRLTSIMNERLESSIDALKNDVAIKSDIQFSNTGVKGGSPEGIKCYGQGNRLSSDHGVKGRRPFCVSKEDGIYADPIDETAFYMCEGEKTTKKLCPWGLIFNPMISVCDFPQDIRFFGNETDFGRKSQSKIITRWTSLPGNAGLKVLSVGGPEENEKHEDSPAPSNVQRPHKIFSINIFKGDHATPTIDTENVIVNQDKEQSSLNNTSANQSIDLQANAKTPPPSAAKEFLQDDLQNTANQYVLQNKSRSIAENTNRTVNKTSRFSDDTLRGETTSNPLPERFSNSDKSLPSFSPLKVFAINLFGLKSKEPMMPNDIQVTNESARLREQQLDLSKQYEDEQVVSNKVPVDPLYTQIHDKSAPHSSDIKSDYDYHQPNQLGDLGNKRLESNLPAMVDSTPSPLHFKLKVQRDPSGKQPVFNCTLSECSETQNGLVTPSTSTAHSSYNHDSQGNTSDDQFHIVLNTVGSDTLKGTVNLDNFQAAGMAELSPMTEVKHHLQDTTHFQMLNKTLHQFTQHLKDNSTSKITAASQEKNDLKVQNSADEHVGTQGGNDTTSNMIRLQNSSTYERQGNDFLLSRITLGRKYEGSMLQNTHSVPPGKENVSNNEFSDQKLNTKLQTTSYHQDSSSIVFPNDTNNNQLQRDAQLENQTFLQTQRTPLGKQPQLKIILKSPGKLGAFTARSAQLKKRTGTSARIVQILKSMINKPLNKGSRKAGVKSTNAVKKSMSGRTSQSDDDSEHIKDSGSIAQSILEANKEYLDDVAMQGMIFSDGDPDTENMTDVADAIKQGHKFLEETSEFSQWAKIQDSSPDLQTADKQDWHDDEHVMQQDGNEEDFSASPVGNGNNNTASTTPSKIGKSPLDASGVFMNNKDALSVTVNHPEGESEVIPYRGGKVKSTVDPRLIHFCIGKTSGIYANPFERKSFLICSSGQTTEMECPNPMQFNIKEKICDLPDTTPKDKK